MNNMNCYKQKDFQKRKYEDIVRSMPDIVSPTVLMFRSYQLELDGQYDKYERLVRKSRDVMIECKRIIFLLHRVNRSANNEEILGEAKHRLSELLKAINFIALELTKKEVHKYIRAFTSGLQEFVKAVSFYYYLRDGTLVSLQNVYNLDFLDEAHEASKRPCIKSQLPLSEFLTPVVYVFGIADLSCELMRRCIDCVGTGDIQEAVKLSVLLRDIYQGLLSFDMHSEDLKQKLCTLKSNVQKVETACYAMKIRGIDTPKSVLVDLFSTKYTEPMEF